MTTPRLASARNLILRTCGAAFLGIAASATFGQSPANELQSILIVRDGAPAAPVLDAALRDRIAALASAVARELELAANDRWPGIQGAPVQLTFSFVPDGVATGFGPNALTATMSAAVGPDWQSRIAQALNEWAALSAITLTEVDDDGAPFPNSPGDEHRGDIRIAAAPIDGGSGVLGVSLAAPNGDILLDTAETWGVGATDLFLRNVVAHMSGHGLGLDNVCPPDGTKLMEVPLSFNIDGPQFDDRLRIQALYGDPQEPNDVEPQSLDAIGFQIGKPFELGNLSLHSEADVDDFALQASGGALSMMVSAEPEGETYLVGSSTDGQPCAAAPFDALRQLDLILDVLDSDGAVIATADAGELGEAESIGSLPVVDGEDYVIRIRAGAATGGDAPIQAYRLLLQVSSGAAADLNGDGIVNGADLAALLSAWGACAEGGPCPTDLNHDGSVNGADLAALLAAWSQ